LFRILLGGSFESLSDKSAVVRSQEFLCNCSQI
jgi:hypothetical protein